jgi:hypothetical protein
VPSPAPAPGKAAADKATAAVNVKKYEEDEVKVEEELKLEELHLAPTGRGGHVFISYQWDVQQVVKLIAQALKREGYEV